jgi:hypothetical protein
MAVVAGITTAWLASPVVPDFIPHDFTGKLALGLLASGGLRILEFNPDLRDKGQRRKGS